MQQGKSDSPGIRLGVRVQGLGVAMQQGKGDPPGIRVGGVD